MRTNRPQHSTYHTNTNTNTNPTHPSGIVRTPAQATTAYSAARGTGVVTYQAQAPFPAQTGTAPAQAAQTPRHVLFQELPKFGAQPRVQNQSYLRAARGEVSTTQYCQAGYPAQAPAERGTGVSTNQSPTQFGAPAQAAKPQAAQAAQAQVPRHFTVNERPKFGAPVQATIAQNRNYTNQPQRYTNPTHPSGIVRTDQDQAAQAQAAQTGTAQAPAAQAPRHPKSGVPAQAPATRWTEVSTNQSTTQFGAPAAIEPKTGQPAQAQDRAQRKVVAPLRAPVRPQVQLQIPVTGLPQNLNQRGASIELFQKLDNYSFFRDIKSIKDIDAFVDLAKDAIEAKILFKEDKHNLNIRLVDKYLLKYKHKNQKIEDLKIEDLKKIAEQFSADARKLYPDDDSGYVDLFKEAMTMGLINSRNISFSRDIKSIKDIDAFVDLAECAIKKDILSKEDKHDLNIGLVDKYLLKYKPNNQKKIAEWFIADAKKLYPDDHYGRIDLLSLFNKASLKEVTAKPPVLEQVPNTGPLQIPVTGPLQNLTQAQPPVPTTHLSLSPYYNRPAPDTASSTGSLNSSRSSQSLDSSRSSLVSATVPVLVTVPVYEEKLSNPSQILPPQTTIEPTKYTDIFSEWVCNLER